MFVRSKNVRAIVAALFVLAAWGAQAATPNQLAALLGKPGWVLAPAVVDLNFAQGLYYLYGANGPLTTGRASSGTSLLPSSPSGASYKTFGNNVARITPGLGILVEETRTNFLLNSTTPATQTTGSLGTGTYTLWVNGAGSAAMSLGTGVGCGVGSATQGTPISFTLTVAGTCIVTVTGSLNEFQLEKNPGTVSAPTSFIPTTSSIATRLADNVSISINKCNSPSLWATGTTYNPTSYTNNSVAVGVNDGTGNNYFVAMDAAGPAQTWAYNGVTFNALSFGTWTQGVSGKITAALNGSTLQGKFSGSSASGAFPGTPNNSVLAIGSSVSSSYWNGYVQRLALACGSPSLLNY